MGQRVQAARPRSDWKTSVLLLVFSLAPACNAEIGPSGTPTGPRHQGGASGAIGVGGVGGSSTMGSSVGGGGMNSTGTGGSGGTGGDPGPGGATGGTGGNATGGSGGSGGAGGAGGGPMGGAGGGATGGSGGSGNGGEPPLGTGWIEYTPMKSIHLDDNVDLQTFAFTTEKSVCNPPCADYRYDSASDTETFRVLDNRSNRAEIRLHNEYSTGSRQFQGYVKFDRPLDDESLFQIFGSTSGATQLMVRGYAASGGSIRAPGGPVLATNVYGVEHRVNVIHRQGTDIRVYIDGVLKYSFADNETVTNYQKYGCYGTLTTGAATVAWRAARFYRDGAPP